MSSITFTSGTIVPATWLNDVNNLIWSVFNGKATAGTNGTILQSNGTNIVNTTATYPSVAGTSGTILQSNGTNIVNSTATYPVSTTINQILFSSATNTVTGITAANNGVLVTSAGGVPSISSTLPSGLTIPNLFSPQTLQTFTANGTWNRPAGCKSVLIEVQGGGGAGGGAPATAAGQASLGQGGYAGGYAAKYINVTAISSATITIPAAAAGISGTAGANGGDAVWSDGVNTITGKGGAGGLLGGPGTPPVIFQAGVALALGINGDLNIKGFPPQPLLLVDSITPAGYYGRAGDSKFGAGGQTRLNLTGSAANGPGAGGGGTVNAASTAAQIGGAGGSGQIIVWEYY